MSNDFGRFDILIKGTVDVCILVVPHDILFGPLVRCSVCNRASFAIAVLALVFLSFSHLAYEDFCGRFDESFPAFL